MCLRKIVLALMAILVFSIPTAGGRFSFDVGLGPLGLMSIIGLLAFLFAVAFLLFGNRGLGRTPVPVDRSVVLFGLFVALNFASVGWAQAPVVAISSSISWFQLLIFVWLLLFLRSEPKAFGILLHAFFFGSLLVAAGVLYDVVSAGLDTLDRRLEGFDMNSNRFAYKMALGIPVAFYLSQRGFPRLRWVYLSYIPAAAFLVMLSGSRTGTVALLFALATIFWLIVKVEDQGQARFSIKRLLLLTAVLTALAVFLLPYISGQFQAQMDRIATVTDPFESGFGNRWDLWVAGFGVYLENMLLGVGSGGSRTAILPYFESDVYIFSFLGTGVSLHNVYLAIASETGTIGFLLYVAAIVSLASRIRTFPRQEEFLCLSLIGVSLIAALAGTIETTRDFNFALFISVMYFHQHPKQKKLPSESGRTGITSVPVR